MTTRKRDRFFALFGAILFLGTASALTIAVIVSNVSNKSSSSSDQTANQSSQTCSDNLTEQILPVPDVYKLDGKVSSLQSTDLEAGNGQAAKSGDCLVVKYYGTLASNGTKFDENFTSPSAFAFKLGQGQVIPGWDQGLVGLKVGGTRRVVIPSALAYGPQANGSIPANADLVFVVKLLRIE